MLLPDIIDKSLYYSHAFPDWITCTRTFGHTGLLLITVLLLSRLVRSRHLAALALGMATHLLPDCLIDRFDPSRQSSTLVALTWPFLHARFAVYHFDSIWDHLHHVWSWPIMSAEALGLAFLGWDYWKSAYRKEMLQVLFSKRWRRMRRHRLERG
jgi:hypothetical protein